MKKGIVAGFVLLLAAFGMLVAQGAAKKREFTGLVSVSVCEKDAAGGWQVVDELNAQSVKFVSSVTEAAGQKGVATDFSFTGRTTKGRTISVRLKPGAKADVNLATGLLALDLPFSITIEGKQVDSALKLTTESAQGAKGPLSGRRAVIDKSTHTAKLALVGSTLLKSPIVLAPPSTAGLTVDQKVQEKGDLKKDKVETRQAAKNPEVLLVVTGDGTLKALD